MTKIARSLRRPCVLRAGAFLAVAMATVQAGATSLDIGVTSLVVKQVEGTLDQRTRQLALSDRVYQDEVVETGFRSASELHLADDTRITVGPNSKIVLDSFVYDPEPGKGALVLQATEGVFRFFSGNMDSTNYRIEAASVTVGIRGTIFVGAVRPSDGAFVLILESRDSQIFIRTRTGNTFVLDKPGQAAIALSDGTVSGVPAPEWAVEMVETMDGTVVAANNPGPVPAPGGDPDQAAPQLPAPAADEQEPEPEPEPQNEGKLRGLLRALFNQDPEDVPPGLQTAIEKDSTARARGGEAPGHGSRGNRSGNAGGGENGNGGDRGNGKGGGRR